ncbi:uncharacterized protein LOC106672736 isoform X2 [Cimex lectularius]|uniref:RPGRIP1 C-terminal domain-containing protein n=1 Tax=Cimex lectularius TaxID=79782 RepID=A0A8I6S9E1_CIMLE|nr:uncharacterized protein LOC106672736 isoform X2 [Cimex lectularius]
MEGCKFMLAGQGCFCDNCQGGFTVDEEDNPTPAKPCANETATTCGIVVNTLASDISAQDLSEKDISAKKVPSRTKLKEAESEEAISCDELSTRQKSITYQQEVSVYDTTLTGAGTEEGDIIEPDPGALKEPPPECADVIGKQLADLGDDYPLRPTVDVCEDSQFTYKDKSGKIRGLSLGGTGGAVFDPYLLADRTLGCMLLKKLGICLCGQDEDVGNVVYKSVDFGIDYASVYYPPPCKAAKKGLEADFTMNIVNLVLYPATAEYYLRDGGGQIFLTWSYMSNPEPHFSQLVEICDPVFCTQTVYSGNATRGFLHYLAHHGIPIKLFQYNKGRTTLLGEGVINTQPVFQYPGKHVYIVTKIVGGATIGILRGWYELDCVLDLIYEYLDYAREEHHRYAILAAHTGPRLRRVDETKLGSGDECITRHEVLMETERWILDKQIRKVNNQLVGSTQPYQLPPGEVIVHFQDLDECNSYEYSKRFEAYLFSDGGQLIRPAEVCEPIPRPCDAEEEEGAPPEEEEGMPLEPLPPPEPTEVPPPPLPEPPPPLPPAEYVVDEGDVEPPGPRESPTQRAAPPPPPTQDFVSTGDLEAMYRNRIKYPPRYTFRRLIRRTIREKFFAGCKMCLGNRNIMFNVYDMQKAQDVGFFCANYLTTEADEMVIEIIRLELDTDVVDELQDCYEALFVDFAFLGHIMAETLGYPPASRIMYRTQNRFCFSRNFNMKERSILKEMLRPTGKITSTVIRFLVVGDPGDDPNVGGRCWDIAFADLRLRSLIQKKRGVAKKIALPVYSFTDKRIGKLVVRIFGRRLMRCIFKERTQGPCVPVF